MGGGGKLRRGKVSSCQGLAHPKLHHTHTHGIPTPQGAEEEDGGRAPEIELPTERGLTGHGQG